jgi:hypothetical protein
MTNKLLPIFCWAASSHFLSFLLLFLVFSALLCYHLLWFVKLALDWKGLTKWCGFAFGLSKPDADWIYLRSIYLPLMVLMLFPSIASIFYVNLPGILWSDDSTQFCIKNLYVLMFQSGIVVLMSGILSDDETLFCYKKAVCLDVWKWYCSLYLSFSN